MDFLPELNKTLRAARLTHRGATVKPEQAPRGTQKGYSRFERIKLEKPAASLLTLDEALKHRVSFNEIVGARPLSLSDIATLFGHAFGAHPDSLRRHYPSGGALFPVETYLIARTIEDGTGGVYHYHAKSHSLERLWNLPDGFSMADLVSKPEIPEESCIILFTSVWKRSSSKYGYLAYMHALLEAGHMSQNALLLATALRLSSRPIAGFTDEIAMRLLDIESNEEQPVHSIVLFKRT